MEGATLMIVIMHVRAAAADALHRLHRHLDDGRTLFGEEGRLRPRRLPGSRRNRDPTRGDWRAVIAVAFRYGRDVKNCTDVNVSSTKPLSLSLGTSLRSWSLRGPSPANVRVPTPGSPSGRRNRRRSRVSCNRLARTTATSSLRCSRRQGRRVHNGGARLGSNRRSRRNHPVPIVVLDHEITALVSRIFVEPMDAFVIGGRPMAVRSTLLPSLTV